MSSFEHFAPPCLPTPRAVSLSAPCRYVATLIDRARLPLELGAAEKGLEYSPPPAGSVKTLGTSFAEDGSFSFGKAPLSITDLCVRHQYCEHVRGKERKLLHFDGDEGGGPPPPGTVEGLQLARLQRGDAAGVEALAALFIPDAGEFTL
jgi:hypothetical protein